MSLGMGKKRRNSADGGAEDVVGFFESGVEMEGKLKITVPDGLFRVNSHFKGEIHSEGKIVILEQGDVEAEIHSRFISIFGKVKGTVHASERIEIKEHGIILGDIYTPCLDVAPGGYFDGQCHMPTPEPARQTATDLDTK